MVDPVNSFWSESFGRWLFIGGRVRLDVTNETVGGCAADLDPDGVGCMNFGPVLVGIRGTSPGGKSREKSLDVEV